uniref:Golgi transport 1B n=1 Tax=Coturnix japonica TaxID=93934 RepID=A0A8C2SRS7_COTJA
MELRANRNESGGAEPLEQGCCSLGIAQPVGALLSAGGEAKGAACFRKTWPLWLRSRRSAPCPSPHCPAGTMISLSDTQKIGMGLTGFGVFFLFFGMILFFDKALLAIGNVLFVAGLAFVIGLERTFRFFFQKHKMKATGFFLGGVLIVLIGWPLIGMILEIYGFFLLFRGFFPVVIGFIRRVPVLGSLLNLPGISSLVDKVGESNNMV